MIEVIRYSEKNKNEWNHFLRIASNSTFMLHRDFMEYHSSKFQDYSLMFYKKRSLIALLPANESDSDIWSHQGLSYGGLIYKSELRFEEIIECFYVLCKTSLDKNFSSLIYKPVPSYYHISILNGDIYLLQKLGAMQNIEASTVVDVRNALPFQQRRKRAITKARNNKLKVESDSNDWESYWHMLSINLKERHKTVPVHSLEEIISLKKLFPNEIQLQICVLEGELLAGIVLFLNRNTAHAQYIASSAKGKELGALDYLVDYLLRRFRHLKYFSLGVNDLRNEGGNLNKGLNDWKEGFGARVWPHYQFEISLEKLLEAKKLFQ